jgi:hypothetical protein
MCLAENKNSLTGLPGEAFCVVEDLMSAYVKFMLSIYMLSRTITPAPRAYLIIIVE